MKVFKISGVVECDKCGEEVFFNKAFNKPVVLGQVIEDPTDKVKVNICQHGSGTIWSTLCIKCAKCEICGTTKDLRAWPRDGKKEVTCDTCEVDVQCSI